MQPSENYKANDLIHETSTYLLQHAYNPVNWLAWNAKSQELARQRNLPVLISIGYSACHWCHVMERESFTNQEVADLLNANFTCIKIDREERPDLDHIYMQALQVITGQGGWPLNVFTLPDMRPFHGGTYFTRQNFIHVLNRVSEEFQQNQPKLETYAQNLQEGLIQQQKPLLKFALHEPDIQLLNQGLETYEQQFDTIHGGDAGNPKFPMPPNLLFLLKWVRNNQQPSIRNHILRTLNNMGMGGIYDQIGGGFARYSTDAYWKVPHFEKMLYDNAQLLKVYAEAFSMDSNPEFKRLCTQTIEWLQREMKSEQGLFYSALDADSEGEEGKFYVWTKEEFSQTLGADADLGLEYYNVNEMGKWEGKYILLRDMDEEKFAAQNGMSWNEWQVKAEAIRTNLLSTRSKRIRPNLDQKIICSWNAMTIRGLCSAYLHLNEPKFLTTAIQTFHSLKKETWQNGKNSLARMAGRSFDKHPGLLEDYAHFGLAALDLYQLTSEVEYLKMANSMTNYLLEGFYDIQNCQFFTTDKNHNDLIFRPSENFDGVMPSSSAAASELLWIGGHLNDNQNWLEISKKLTMSNSPFLEKYLNHFGAWAALYMDMCRGPLEISVLGKSAPDWALTLKRKFPESIMSWSENDADLPLLSGKYDPSQTLIYICQRNTCYAPVQSINEACSLIDGYEL